MELNFFIKPSDDNIALEKFVAASIGVEPHVFPYCDSVKENILYILDCKDPVTKYVKFYCSTGVSDSPNLIEMNDGSKNDIRIEILMIGNEENEHLANILATTGFYVVKNGWPAKPGTIFKDIVNLYVKNTKFTAYYFSGSIYLG